MKSLKDVKVGRPPVVKLHGEGATKRRIMDMGITKGVEDPRPQGCALGDPMELNVRGYGAQCGRPTRRRSRSLKEGLRPPLTLRQTWVCPPKLFPSPVTLSVYGVGTQGSFGKHFYFVIFSPKFGGEISMAAVAAVFQNES